MKEYCGFIEAWKGLSTIGNSGSPIPYKYLELIIDETSKIGGFKTVAVFKIKLK